MSFIICSFKNIVRVQFPSLRGGRRPGWFLLIRFWDELYLTSKVSIGISLTSYEFDFTIFSASSFCLNSLSTFTSSSATTPDFQNFIGLSLNP